MELDSRERGNETRLGHTTVVLDYSRTPSHAKSTALLALRLEQYWDLVILLTLY